MTVEHPRTVTRHHADPTTVNPVGAWDRHYATLTRPLPYGRRSYEPIAAFVEDCDTVEDWGCGGGGLAAYVEDRTPGERRYIGIDGSATPYATHVTDLRYYRSDVDAVVLRHVLEHNDEWQLVLDNAIASARRKLCVVLFTPAGDTTRVMFREPRYGNVPVISFHLPDVVGPIEAGGWQPELLRRASPDTAFRTETLLLCTR